VATSTLVSLIDELRAATRRLHEQAERSGLIRTLLSGNASQTDYALLLRNLLPAYEAMERQLATLPDSHPVATIRDPRLYRARAIRADLATISGDQWADLPLTDAGREYEHRLRSLQGTGGCRIAGHCYTRYLGDLSGGQILRRLLSRKPGLPAAAMRFYEFDLDGSHGSYKARYIAALDAITNDRYEVDAIVDEAIAAFRLNISISEELASLGAQSDDGGSAGPGTR
jgi:heme oxygenase (biliverdin-producing, ferredoxin)